MIVLFCPAHICLCLVLSPHLRKQLNGGDPCRWLTFPKLEQYIWLFDYYLIFYLLLHSPSFPRILLWVNNRYGSFLHKILFQIYNLSLPFQCSIIHCCHSGFYFPGNILNFYLSILLAYRWMAGLCFSFILDAGERMILTSLHCLPGSP